MELIPISDDTVTPAANLQIYPDLADHAFQYSFTEIGNQDMSVDCV